MRLADRSCAPCPPGTPPLSTGEVDRLAVEVPDWVIEDGKLTRTFRLGTFPDAVRFVDEIATVSETERHHPDLAIRYDHVRVEIWTHSVGGLSENDYILAAKIDDLAHDQTAVD